jgi:histone H3/H4
MAKTVVDKASASAPAPAASDAPKARGPRKHGKLSGKARARRDLKNILAENANRVLVFRRAGVRRTILKAIASVLKEFGVPDTKMQMANGALPALQTFVEADGRTLFAHAARLARESKSQGVRVRHLEFIDATIGRKIKGAASAPASVSA